MIVDRKHGSAWHLRPPGDCIFGGGGGPRREEGSGASGSSRSTGFKGARTEAGYSKTTLTFSIAVAFDETFVICSNAIRAGRAVCRILVQERAREVSPAASRVRCKCERGWQTVSRRFPSPKVMINAPIRCGVIPMWSRALPFDADVEEVEATSARSPGPGASHVKLQQGLTVDQRFVRPPSSKISIHLRCVGGFDCLGDLTGGDRGSAVPWPGSDGGVARGCPKSSTVVGTASQGPVSVSPW